MTATVLPLCAILVGCASTRGTTSGPKRSERLSAEKHLAATALSAGRCDQAITILSNLADEASGDRQVMVMLGDAFACAGRSDEAVSRYEKAIHLRYSDYEAHFKLATLLMAMGKTGRALTEFGIAATEGEGVAVVQYNYGVALNSLKREREGRERLRRARDLDPKNATYVAAYAAAMTPADSVRALLEFGLAEGLGASGAIFHNNYGLALERAHKYEQALRRFASAVELEPARESYRFNLATVNMRRGDHVAALAQWDSLETRFGAKWSYRVYAARSLLQGSRFQAAIDRLEEKTMEVAATPKIRRGALMDRDPPSLDEAWEVLALAARGLSHGDRALDYIENAVRLRPDDPSHLNNYGVILAENGRIAEATDQWRKVLAIDGGNRVARENLSRFVP